MKGSWLLAEKCKFLKKEQKSVLELQGKIYKWKINWKNLTNDWRWQKKGTINLKAFIKIIQKEKDVIKFQWPMGQYKAP